MTQDIRIQNWSQFAQRVTQKELSGRWLFRGGLANWGLETSLERAFRDWGLPLSRMLLTERRLLTHFKRAFTLSGFPNPPDKEDTLRWLALMQHHGAPTRLLDWTYSPYVAAYFAMDALLSNRRARKAAVWAISADAFDRSDTMHEIAPSQELKKFLEDRDGPSFDAIFMREQNQLKFVFPVNPWNLDLRLIIQQGVFLCPGDISVTFAANLNATGRAVRPRLRFYRFVFDRSLLSESMAALYRMNMHPASLFPGMDGYARSLRSRLHVLGTANFWNE